MYCIKLECDVVLEAKETLLENTDVLVSMVSFFCLIACWMFCMFPGDFHPKQELFFSCGNTTLISSPPLPSKVYM